MADDGVNIIFVYMGGEQVVPRDVTHVRIHRSVKIIPRWAFFQSRNLMSVETHNEIEKVEESAFCGCTSLKGIKLPGVREIKQEAFMGCTSLTDVEFGNKLETIGNAAFYNCDSLRNIKIPTVRTIEADAFGYCDQLTDVELPDVERIGGCAFVCCDLQRIVIPLKHVSH